MTEPINDLQYKVSTCVEVLQMLLDNTDLLYEIEEHERVNLLKTAGLLSHPTKEEYQRRRKSHKIAKARKERERDKHARKETGIRTARDTDVFIAPVMISAPIVDNDSRKELSSPRNCYVCKEKYTILHHFYDAMCPSCGEFNYAKRHQSSNLKGQVALITGARLKIGYQSTLMMLRAGATVIATTRFPIDAATRYAQEDDFVDWSHRLKIHGLDLRHIPSVDIFCNFVEMHYDRLDILINNAAQTVRRPTGFYKHLMAQEDIDFNLLPTHVQSILKDHISCVNELNFLSNQNVSKEEGNLPVSWHGKQLGIGISASAKLSQIPYAIDNSLSLDEVFPEGKLDVDLQQVDLRKTNSWRLKLGEISATEMIEVQLVNAVSPFVLCNRLSNLMKQENTGQKHIVNVSAMEGKFHRFYKEDRHPHTNMAKAALNMMTHTAATDFAKYGIYMNAVDTGWVTDEDPIDLALAKEEIHDFQPPLDIVDGAARVMDPIFDGINTGKHWCGKFLKDYMPIDW